MSVENLPLRYAATVLVSNVDKKSADGELPVRLVNYTDVYYRPIIRSDQEFMGATATADQVARFGVRPGDSIITKDSETRDDIAVSTYVDQAASDMVCGYHLALLRPSDRVVPKFLSWALASDQVRGQFSIRANGMTRYGLTYDAIQSVAVPLPPMEEQRRIADFLDDHVARIDSAVLAREQQLEAVTLRRVAALDEEITGLGHAAVPLRRVVRPRQGPGAEGAPLLSVYRDLGVVLRSEREDNFNRPPEDESKYQGVAIGDLVVNKMKAWSGSVAVSEHHGLVSPDYLVCELSSRIWPRYLHQALRSPRYVAMMRARSRGIRPNQERLYWDDLGDIRVPLPPVPEQIEISERLDVLMGGFEENRKPFVETLALLNEYKASLITAAVTGEFDVTAARTGVPV